MKKGNILGGKYKIEKVIGKGGTSSVYLARNIILDNLWAIKEYPQPDLYSLEFQEFLILKNLSHPMLPRIADFFEEKGFVYIVMDYIEGINLLDYIKNSGLIPEKKLILWTKDLLDVLAYLHDKNPPVIYRDLKPSNIILDKEERLRLIDFGSARLSKDYKTEDTLYIGTKGYAAPEQYGFGISDERTDLYNLGMTLFHLATGVHPIRIERSNFGKVLRKSGVSAWFTNFILNLCEPDPKKRPQNTGEALKKINHRFNLKSLIFANSRTKNNRKLKDVIAVASVLPNTGVTSFCLMLGCFFRNMGFQTVLAELNASGDFKKIRNCLNQACTLKRIMENSFEAEGLLFYHDLEDSSTISRKEVDILILDLGHIKNSRGLGELNRADIKLVLCPDVPWKFDYIENFNEKFRSNLQDEWIYIFKTPVDKKPAVGLLRKKCNLSRAVVFPFSDFNFSKDMEKQIGKSLEEVYKLSGQKVCFEPGA
jgi:hypothetical protein